MKKITRTEFIKLIKDNCRTLELYDLTQLDLSDINLVKEKHGIRNITFRLCNLMHTNFENSDMQECRYEYCDLSHANFKSTINSKSHFKHCNFYGAHVDFMNISGGEMEYCDLIGMHGFDRAFKHDMTLVGSAVL